MSQEKSGAEQLIIIVVIGAVILGLGYIVISQIVSGFGKGVSNVLGLDVLEEQKKKFAALMKAKLDFLKNIQFDPKAKTSLGATQKAAESMANGVASMLYTHLKGVSNTQNYAVVKEIIMNKLPYKNDIRLVFKAFGLRENQNLADWIQNENMPEDWKASINSRIAASLK